MNPYIFESEKPVVKTKCGQLRGVTYGDVHIFMGIPYATAKRFHDPEELTPWEGVRNAYTYGPAAPLMVPDEPPAYYRGLHMLQRHSEDCQNLNIWAPRTAEREKKPVFVWIHGGGYFAGTAMEEYSFDGFHMAKEGDVVFVSINHRLNLLGHLNLADYGEEFAHSANAGIADLVLALKWIHENITAFGGDPENVTICGHSGGGGKVQCLYQIEEAAPYFQRGMVLSGSMDEGMVDTQETSRKAAKAILDELGITRDTIHRVCEIPYEELVLAFKKALRRLSDEGISVKLSPVKDDYFRGFPLDTGFMPWSAEKPLLLGSTLGEFLMGQPTPEQKASMSHEERIEFLKNRFGEKSSQLIDLFRKTYPAHDLLDLSCMDTMVRIPTLETALLHAKNGLNNTWIYLAAYTAMEDEGTPLWHGGDVCYLLMNEDRVFVLNEAVYGQKLAGIFSSLALNFTRTGNPNNGHLPNWMPITQEHPYTMVIDRECSCLESHDKELLTLLDKENPRFVLDFARFFER